MACGDSIRVASAILFRVRFGIGSVVWSVGFMADLRWRRSHLKILNMRKVWPAIRISSEFARNEADSRQTFSRTMVSPHAVDVGWRPGVIRTSVDDRPYGTTGIRRR